MLKIKIVIKSIGSYWLAQVIMPTSMPHGIWDACGTQLGMAIGLEGTAHLISVY